MVHSLSLRWVYSCFICNVLIHTGRFEYRGRERRRETDGHRGGQRAEGRYTVL